MNTRILCFAISGVMLLLGSAQTHAQAVAQGRLLASDAAPQNNFSQSMDIDGDVAVISNSTGTNPYVFERVNGVWTEVARLAPGESTVGYSYAIDVAVSGNTIAVGSSKSSGALPHFGLVYLFEKINGSWIKVARLTAANANTPQDDFGGNIDLSGNRLVAGEGYFNGHGAAYVYVKTAAGWQFESLLIASDHATYDSFGGEVAIEGDRILLRGLRQWQCQPPL